MATIWLRFDGFPTGGGSGVYVATLHDKDTDEYYDAVAQDWGGTIGGTDNEITLTELTAEYAGSYEATAALPSETAVRKVIATLHNTADSDKPLGSYVLFVRNGTEVHEGDLSFDIAAVSTKLGTPAGASVSADVAAGKTVVDAIKLVTDALTAAAAAKLATSAGQMVTFTVDNSVLTPTTTQFECDDITEATAEHYKDRVVIFTSGALAGQAKAITAYSKVGSNGRFTVGTLTEAPANNDTGLII